jgi:NAD(P)-dependent dehydrogenase (short-subunit alcohol dehydrogenase family)
MKGRVVILAGGSGGLGAATAEALAERGVIPVIGCRTNVERAQSLAQKLSNKYDLTAPVVVGDILDEQVRRQILDVAHSAGDVYGLVPFVGNPARIPIETASEQDFLESMRTNFVAPVLLARDFAGRVAGKDAAIVFISTMQGIGVFAGSTVYAASKAALIHAGRILSKQWDIRVNIVAPGVNNAGMAEQSVRSGKYDSFLQKKVIPRYGNPSDVARAVVFFLEPDNYVTGQVLAVDGGFITKL